MAQPGSTWYRVLDGGPWWVLGFGTFVDSRVEKPTRGGVAVGLRDEEKDIWERPGGWG